MNEFEEFEFNSTFSNCLLTFNVLIEDMASSLLAENYDADLDDIMHKMPTFIHLLLIPICLEINFLKEINNLKNNSDFMPLNLNIIKSLIQNFKLENLTQESWHLFVSEEDIREDEITDLFNLNKSLILCINLTYGIIDMSDDDVSKLDFFEIISKLDISQLQNTIYVNYSLEALNCIFKYIDEEHLNQILHFLLRVMEHQPVFMLKRSAYKIIEKITLNVSSNKITWAFFKNEIFKASENVAPLLLQLFKYFKFFIN